MLSLPKRSGTHNFRFGEKYHSNLSQPNRKSQRLWIYSVQLPKIRSFPCPHHLKGDYNLRCWDWRRIKVKNFPVNFHSKWWDYALWPCFCS